MVESIQAIYVDLPGLGLPRLGPFDPFIGAGAGVVRTRIGETRMMFPATITIVPGARRTDFAWMVTAGVATALNERTTLDLAWRYTDLGTVRTGRAKARWYGATGVASRCRSIWPRHGRSSGATGSGCHCATRSFAAFLPQFYDPQHGLLPQFLMMAGTFVGIEVVVEILLAAFASRLATYVTSGAGTRLFNRATGSVFVLAGAYLLTLERPR